MLVEQRYDMVKMQQADMLAEAAANHMANDARPAQHRHGGMVVSLATHVRALAGTALHHQQSRAGATAR